MGEDRAEIWEDPLVNMLVRNLNWWYHGAPRRSTGQAAFVEGPLATPRPTSAHGQGSEPRIG